MKRHQLLAIALGTVLLASCGKYQQEKFVEIEPNETAFVIPLEGNENDQKKFESVDYLEQQKVAAKRIPIPTRKKTTGRGPGAFDWIDTVRVVTIDRSPSTRQWTGTDQRKAGAALAVESQDSIGFTVGMNITAYVDEKDTSKFLYYYRAQQLDSLIDTNIRGFVQMKLSEEFANLPLQNIKEQKNEIIEKVRTQSIEHFKQYGVTITALGMSEGLEFEDPKIQDEINQSFIAEQAVIRQQQMNKKELELATAKTKIQEEQNKQLMMQAKGQTQMQEETNAKLLAEAKGKAEAAALFEKTEAAQTKQVELQIRLKQAEAQVEAAKSWKGTPPQFIMGGNSGATQPPYMFNMSLPTPTASTN